jgi:hypothetical protein
MTGQLDTLKKKEEWLEAHRKIGIVTATCRKTKIQRSTVYFWMDHDPEFKAAVADAEKEAIELLESEARRRAHKGTIRPVFYKGEKCGSIREYSDFLENRIKFNVRRLNHAPTINDAEKLYDTLVAQKVISEEKTFEQFYRQQYLNYAGKAVRDTQLSMIMRARSNAERRELLQ